MEPKKKEFECKLNVKKHDSQFNNKDDTEKCGDNLFDNYNFTIITKLENFCVGLREEKDIKYLQRIGRIIYYGGKRLISKEAVQLENELATKAKWCNNFSTGCIRSMECEILTVNKENVYNKCVELNIKKNFVFKYLKNSNLNELYYSIDLTQDFSFWAKLAEKSIIWDKEYEIFKQNLAGQMLRNIRLHYAQSDKSIIIGLIPNNNKKKTADILAYHQKVLQYAVQLKINIVSFGSDGIANKFNIQSMLMNIPTIKNIIFEDKLYNIKFKCLVFPGIGLIICIQDAKHKKKSERNVLFSGARLLILGTGTARYVQILTLSKMSNSILYMCDVENADQ
ncbi:hypothetical protein GLOIN_2v1787768 [Rhizophagus clarus]|uniref:Uncharacterized protein n=1 Tax=Rhizophagus clarus TaxID=94130 RepID=A0A8H3R2X3_9GLOM|nr:hypothetical protein GLOIN_2v1787768 [Rhizophagus clarus]